MKSPWFFLPVLALGAASCANTNQQIQQILTAESNMSSSMDYDLLADLPEPVRRYLRYAVPENYPAIENVQLIHSGGFKRSVDADWDTISGRQYFNAQRPEFLWIGTTSLFQAHDAYIDNAGSLKVYLFNRLRIVNETGKHMDQGELLRWLGEAVWFPTTLIPHEGKNLSWTEIDNNTARLDFEHNGISVWYIVSFNEQGQITRLETERFIREGQLERWEGRVSNYQNIDGLMVPMHIEASWLFKEHTHTYADFNVESITYN